MIEILHIEDNLDDAELIEHILKKARIDVQVTIVQNAHDLSENLENKKFDVILSDYTLPSFYGTAALEIAKQKSPQTPFLFVSGTIGEDAAIQAMLNGAADYVLKQNLKRLVPAVKRAVQEAQDKVERKKLEEQLRQAQKMELVGQLVSGVAHDFNNVLTIIEGYSELLRESLDAGDSRRPFVDEIALAAERAASLTGQLLAFSKQQLIQSVVLDLNNVVRRTQKMLGRLIGEDVSLTTNLCQDPLPIVVDEGQLEQILMNLAVNARDAMPRGGRLTISTMWDTEIPINQISSAAVSIVVLVVSDTGCGMNRETSAHIFEPFFTTKQTGTGLGLATVQKIVQESNARIEVESIPGTGTSFRIFWPRATGSEIYATKRNPPVLVTRGIEKILLVEDDPALRGLFIKVFTESGYAVLQARDGEEAETLCREHKGQVDIVLTDIVMSKMSGPEFVGSILKEWPKIKILFMSGHTAEIFGKYDMDSSNINFIQKPFTSTELLLKIRELLTSEMDNLKGEKND